MKYHIEHERVVRRTWELSYEEVRTAIRQYVLSGASGVSILKGIPADDLQVEICFDDDTLVVTGAKVVWEAEKTIDPTSKEA